jgi:N-acetylmuramic acid 6-phosphate (MurNAc-6-P) etherase
MIDLRPTNDKLRRRAVRTVSALSGRGAAAARRALSDTGWSVRRALHELGVALPERPDRRDPGRPRRRGGTR